MAFLIAFPPSRRALLTQLHWRKLFALLIGFAFAPAMARAQNAPIEFAVKAAYLYKFAPFVEWPASAFNEPGSPFVLCFVGTSPVAALAEEAVRGQTVGGRPILIRRLASNNGVLDSSCHILFAGTAQEPSSVAALERVRGKPVLTVTDATRESKVSSVINFVVQDNRVRFAIDLAAAAENGLVISSKLLNLAIAVRPKS